MAFVAGMQGREGMAVMSGCDCGPSVGPESTCQLWGGAASLSL